MNSFNFLPHYNSPDNQNRSDILIVADSLVKKELVNSVCDRLNTNADLLYIDTSRATRSGVVKRHLSYFILAIKSLFMSQNYKNVIFWQQFIGLYWSTLTFLRHGSDGVTILLPLIYKSRKGILGKVYRSCFSFSLAKPALKLAVCHSSDELKYYRQTFPLSKNKIFFMHYGQSSKATDGDRRKFALDTGNYIFSGGTSNRDFAVLVSAATKMKLDFIIACTQYDIRGIQIPDNVKIFHDAYGEKFHALMHASRAVVLTLKNPNISSGQIVLLKAMEMGKPIVATMSAGIRDYVDESCAYLIEPGNAEQVQIALTHVINNPKDAEQRAAKARERYYEKYTLQKFALNIANLIAEHIKTNSSD